MKIAIVGAGFSGSVLARELCEIGDVAISVFESRNHLGGNCFTERDKISGILIHKYGPHIFHTDDEDVWAYVNQFVEFVPYVNRVKANVAGNVYSLPINLHTINQFFEKSMDPREAKTYIKKLAHTDIASPKTFEEQALKFMGKDLYQAFFEGYTLKQWGISPKNLPASILKRLPMRFNYDDNYFNHRFQGMPKDGYTPIFEKLLDHENICVHLNTRFDKSMVPEYQHVFYSGPLDAWFGCNYGNLDYRTLDFEEIRSSGDFQGCAVMNYPDFDVPYTRITEHKYFMPTETNEHTVCFKEYSRLCESGDVPYYPIRLVKDKSLLQKYVHQANSEKNVSFIGRLGTYRYLDMDVTIKEALFAAKSFKQSVKFNKRVPNFFTKVI